ncbi:TetR/AcrR family transcriptional repressor of lmrAB and yxaGH operons [Paenibacillus phyllosphaerae]|uniref:TetR/AcrR family transcriptional repressor of lmrAB and yxaGH operons n=1 Tax=Paenibacillus phyllosphaerae TaxID=274593 RepID=A0A7W5AXK2_9BACL|nr:TetR/AcrR family transcriptional regulator [Paenibacillus phyllosphaerae]MBB3110625.1 TetR/AcrR family transcriptional repressor of lmrAB and yxaGH operons [Paenibacillus phyllosphaerae]
MGTEKPSSKDIILETAARLFAKQGYHGTGLNQIIRESGAPKGSLYYYFPRGKEELAIACVNLIRRGLQDKIMEQMAKARKPADFMRNFVRDMADSIDVCGTDGLIPFGFWAAAETSAVSDSLRDACKVAFKEWKAILAAKLVELGVEHELADGKADLAVCLIEGATIMAIVERESRAMRRVAEHLPVILSVP